MARQFVVFVVVVFVVMGFACAAPTAESPKASTDNTDVGAILAPGADDAIGNIDGAAAPGNGDDVVEGPVGGPGASSLTPAESPASNAFAVKFSIVTVMAAVATFFFF